MILESRHDHHQLLLDELKYNKSNSSLPNMLGRSKESKENDYLAWVSEVEAVEYVLMLS